MADLNNINTDHLKKLFYEPLIEALGNTDLIAGMELIGDFRKTSDASLKMIIRDKKSIPRAVVLYSSPVCPDMISRGIKMAKRAKDVLGDELGAVILDPLKHGDMDDRSYGIFSYRQPISKFKLKRYLQKRILVPSITRWLRDVLVQTSHPASDNEINHHFIMPIEYMIKLKEAGAEVSAASQSAKHRLESGKWAPKHTLMHNDLWTENILINNASFYLSGQNNFNKFIVIDWPGSNENGYAIYDLVRFAQSMGLKSNSIISEITEHCNILCCDPEDAMGYMLTALGNIGLNLGCFPLESFVRLAKLCFNYLAANLYKK